MADQVYHAGSFTDVDDRWGLQLCLRLNEPRVIHALGAHWARATWPPKCSYSISLTGWIYSATGGASSSSRRTDQAADEESGIPAHRVSALQD
jgi:hypothetical protein